MCPRPNIENVWSIYWARHPQPPPEESGYVVGFVMGFDCHPNYQYNIGRSGQVTCRENGEWSPRVTCDPGNEIHILFQIVYFAIIIYKILPRFCKVYFTCHLSVLLLSYYSHHESGNRRQKN